MPVTELRGVGASVEFAELSQTVRDSLLGPAGSKQVRRQDVADARTAAKNVSAVTLGLSLVDIVTTDITAGVGTIVLVQALAEVDKGAGAGTTQLLIRETAIPDGIEWFDGILPEHRWQQGASATHHRIVTAIGVVNNAGTKTIAFRGASFGSDGGIGANEAALVVYTLNS